MNLRQKIEFLMERKNCFKKSELSKETGIPYTTLDSILKRDSFENVKFSTLKALCNYFDVDLRYLCFDEIENPDFGKEITSHSLGNALIIDNPRLNSLVENFNQMNEQGQEKVCEYAADLNASGRYKKCSEPNMVQNA